MCLGLGLGSELGLGLGSELGLGLGLGCGLGFVLIKVGVVVVVMDVKLVTSMK